MTERLAPAKGILLGVLGGLLLWAGMGCGVCLLLQLLNRLGWFWYDGAVYTEDVVENLPFNRQS